MFRELVLGAAGVLCLAAAASAHVTLENAQAPVGAPYKAVLRVPHGCEGAATIALRIRVPDGMIAVKPMPKPGWKIETVHGNYSKTYNFPMPITTNSSSPPLSPTISKPVQSSMCRSCRNVRKAFIAGSRYRPPANHRAIIPSLLRHCS
jgi:hypothetical protein